MGGFYSGAPGLTRICTDVIARAYSLSLTPVGSVPFLFGTFHPDP